jgi:hypothetical protein
MKTTLLGSAPTIESLTALISGYYMGSTITVTGEDVHNRKGKIQGVRVIQKGQRWRFESINPA